MTARSGVVAAVDLGATSGRVVLGRIGPDRLDIEVVHRFPNRPVRIADGLHWDILGLYREVLEGLRKAVAAEPDLGSIGIDSWAVDYGLFRRDRLIGCPYHYRDQRTSRGVGLVHGVVGPAALYAMNGLQFLAFNTLYQLAVDRDDGLLDDDTRMLLVPDLLVFWLTGEQRTEQTNASTTGLLDVLGGGWNTALLDKLNLPHTLLPPLVLPGEVIGRLSPEVCAAIGAARPLDVVAVGSHDTASAVVGVPLASPEAAYISSGTWSLVGMELDEPVLTGASRIANFTNEGGVDGRIRYLRNAMGMWVLNECVDAWRREDEEAELERVLDDAAHASRWVVFDVDHPSLVPAGDMPSRVERLVADAGQTGLSRGELVRSILESLAHSYAVTLDELEALTGVAVDTVHLVGGGSQNPLLCQLVADHSGRTVAAGPVEATAIGNVVVQARAAGLVSGDLEAVRLRVAAAFPPRWYEPKV